MKQRFLPIGRSILLVLLLLFAALPLAAARSTVSVEPVRNVAGSVGAPITSQLAAELTAALQSSTDFSVKTGETVAAFQLQNTLTKVDSFVPKEEKDRVKALIKQVMGKDANDNDITAAERNAAKAKLAEISQNPAGTRITTDVLLVDNTTGTAIFSQTLTGEGMGATAEEASYKASKDLAMQILDAMTAHVTPQATAVTPSPATVVETPPAEPATTTNAPAPVTATTKGFRSTVGDMDGETLYIAKGNNSLTPGDILTIARTSGDVVIDGKVVGKKEKTIGTAKVTEIHDEYIVLQVLNKTENIQVGDIIKG